MKQYCRGREVKDESEAITRNPILAQDTKKLYELLPAWGKYPRFFDTSDYPLILIVEKCAETIEGIKYRVLQILKT